MQAKLNGLGHGLTMASLDRFQPQDDERWLCGWGYVLPYFCSHECMIMYECIQACTGTCFYIDIWYQILTTRQVRAQGGTSAEQLEYGGPCLREGLQCNSCRLSQVRISLTHATTPALPQLLQTTPTRERVANSIVGQVC